MNIKEELERYENQEDFGRLKNQERLKRVRKF